MNQILSGNGAVSLNVTLRLKQLMGLATNHMNLSKLFLQKMN
jgi:hypothetical protein